MSFNRTGVNQKPTLDEINAIVDTAGLRCVSTSYAHAHASLVWECFAKKHQFRGHWVYVRNRLRGPDPACSKCARDMQRAEVTPALLKRIRDYVAERGGELISGDVSTARGHVVVRCAKHGIWRSAWWSMMRDRSWCRKCHIEAMTGTRRHRTLNLVRARAIRHGGACVSTAYDRSTDKLQFECEAKHEFVSTAPKVLAGHWCRKCAIVAHAQQRRMPLDEICELARSRGGKCLTEEYTSGSMKLEWECANGHRWSTRLFKIKIGQWCPDCSAGLGERLCRAFFEQLFDTRFPSTWPVWLRSENGRKLQLDGYSERLRLAFEHQGRQHYSKTKVFSTTDEALEKRISDDETKRRICAARGVTLIEVREIPQLLPLSQVRKFIGAECRRRGIILPATFFQIQVDLRSAYMAGSFQRLRKKVPAISKGRLQQRMLPLGNAS
jgi:hypothetical protein